MGAAMPLSTLPLAVMFWNGTAFVPADSLPVGDMSLASAQLTIHGFGSTAEIRRVDLHPQIRTTLGTRDAVFYAWTAPPQGESITRCVMPVDLKTGLHVSTHVIVDEVEEDVVTAFVVGATPGPKLKEGSYVLCAAQAAWQLYELVSGPNGAQVVSRSDQSPAPFQHVVVTVVRA